MGTICGIIGSYSPARFDQQQNRLIAGLPDSGGQSNRGTKGELRDALSAIGKGATREAGQLHEASDRRPETPPGLRPRVEPQPAATPVKRTNRRGRGEFRWSCRVHRGVLVMRDDLHFASVGAVVVAGPPPGIPTRTIPSGAIPTPSPTWSVEPSSNYDARPRHPG